MQTLRVITITTSIITSLLSSVEEKIETMQIKQGLELINNHRK